MAKDKGPLPSAAPADDKKRAIDTAMAQIEKMYGKGSIMRFGDRSELNVDYIPTGSLALDVALGIGGLPKGRIIEIYGAGILRQDHAGPARGGGGPEAGG